VKYNPLTNQDFAALANGLPVELTATPEGTGSATAWISGNYLFVLCVDCQHVKYVNVTTPIAFDILDIEIIHTDGVTCSVQCLNTGDAISDDVTLAASDTDIDRPTTIDNDYNSFDAGDDDLRFEVSTAGLNALIICVIDK